MLWFFKSFFPVVWIAFLLYWRIKAADTKTTQRREPAAPGILRTLAFLIVIVLLSTTSIPLPWLYRQLWPSGIWPFGVGAAITVVGLLFAVWARQHLASNWSSSVTIKQGHELITTGPYTLVRHPDIGSSPQRGPNSTIAAQSLLVPRAASSYQTTTVLNFGHVGDLRVSEFLIPNYPVQYLRGKSPHRGTAPARTKSKAPGTAQPARK